MNDVIEKLPDAFVCISVITRKLYLVCRKADRIEVFRVPPEYIEQAGQPLGRFKINASYN